MNIIKKNHTLKILSYLGIISPLFIKLWVGKLFLPSFIAGGLCFWGWRSLQQIEERQKIQKMEQFKVGRKRKKIAQLVATLKEIEKKKRC